MSEQTNQGGRIAEVKRIFEDFGFGQPEAFESWDGEDLEELREFLSDEEFQTLLDELEGLELEG